MGQIANKLNNFSKKLKEFSFSVLPSFLKSKLMPLSVTPLKEEAKNNSSWAVFLAPITQIQKRFYDSTYGRAFSTFIFNFWLEVRYFYSKGAKKELSIVWSQIILFQDARHFVISFGTLFFISFRVFGCKNWLLTEKNTSLPATVTSFQSLPYKNFIQEDVSPYTYSLIPSKSPSNELAGSTRSNFSTSNPSWSDKKGAAAYSSLKGREQPGVNSRFVSLPLGGSTSLPRVNAGFVSLPFQGREAASLPRVNSGGLGKQSFELIGSKAYIQKRFTPNSVWYHGTKILPIKHKRNGGPVLFSFSNKAPGDRKAIAKQPRVNSRLFPPAFTSYSVARYSISGYTSLPVVKQKAFILKSLAGYSKTNKDLEILANGFSFWSAGMPGKTSNRLATFWLKNWYGESLNFPKQIQNGKQPSGERLERAPKAPLVGEVNIGFQERPEVMLYTYPYLKPKEIVSLRLQRFYQAIATGWKLFLFNTSGYVMEGTALSKSYFRGEKAHKGHWNSRSAILAPLTSNQGGSKAVPNSFFTFANTSSKEGASLGLLRRRRTSALAKQTQRLLASEFTANSLLATGPQQNNVWFSDYGKGLNNIWQGQMLDSTSSVVINFVSNLNLLPSALKSRPVPKVSPESKFDFIFHYNFIWPLKPVNDAIKTANARNSFLPQTIRKESSLVAKTNSSRDQRIPRKISHSSKVNKLKQIRRQQLLSKPIRPPETAYIFDPFGQTLGSISKPNTETNFKNFVFSGPFLGQKRHYAGFNFSNVDPTLGSKRVNLRKKQVSFAIENQNLLAKKKIEAKQQLNSLDSNAFTAGIKEFGNLLSSKFFSQKKPMGQASLTQKERHLKVKPVSFLRRENEITAKKAGNDLSQAIWLSRKLPLSKEDTLFTRKDFQNQWKKPRIKTVEKAKSSLTALPHSFTSAQFAYIADSNDVFSSFAQKRRKRGLRKFKHGRERYIWRRSQDTKGVKRFNHPSNILPSIDTTRQFFLKDWKQKQLDQISHLLENDAKQIKQFLIQTESPIIFDQDKNLVTVLPKEFSKKLQKRLETTTSLEEITRIMQPFANEPVFSAKPSSEKLDTIPGANQPDTSLPEDELRGIRNEQNSEANLDAVTLRGSEPKWGVLAGFYGATTPKIKVSLVNDHKKLEWPRSYIDYDSFYRYLTSVYSVQNPSFASSTKQSVHPVSRGNGEVKYNFIPWTQNYDDQEAVLNRSKLPVHYKTKTPFYDFETRTPFQSVIRLIHTVPRNSQNSISTLWWRFRKQGMWSQLGLWQNLGSEISYTKHKTKSGQSKTMESAPSLGMSWLSLSGIAFLSFLGVVLNKIYSNYGDEILEFVQTVDAETKAAALPQLLPEQLPYNEFEKIDDLLLRDVMGLDSSLFILGDIAWFYRNKCRHHTASITVPKAVLLTGPPGIGKTYLSRALAGEAGVPIITQSGGNIKGTKDREEDGSLSPKAPADVITQLFAKARQMAPCLVFVDEIDAIAQTRNNLFYDVTVDYKHFLRGVRMDKVTHLNTPDKEFKRKLAHVTPTSLLDQQKAMFLEQPSPVLPKERDLEKWEPNPLDRLVTRESEFLAKDYRRNVRIQGRWDYSGKKQTLDYSMLVEFLIQLDNLQVADGIVVLGATNRFFALDAAFLRPGRFGSLVSIELPSKLQRIQLLQKLASQTEPWCIDGIISNSFSQNKPGVQPDLSWDYIGNLSQGLSGAELAAVVNQSVLESVLLKTENHTTETFEKAIETLLSRDQAEDTVADQKSSNPVPSLSVETKQLQLTNQLSQKELPNDGLTYVMDSATIAQQAFYQAAKATLYTLLLDHPPAIYLPLWPRKLNQRHAARTGFKIPEYSSGIFYSKRELEIYLIGLYAGKAGQVMAGLSYFATSTAQKERFAALWSQSSSAQEDLQAAKQLVLYMVDETFLYSQQIASLKFNPLEVTQLNFLNFNSTNILRHTITSEQLIKDIITPAKMVHTSMILRVNLSKASKFALLELDELELVGNEDPIWNAFWIKDKRALELNPEWIRPDRFFHNQPNTKSLVQQNRSNSVRKAISEISLKDNIDDVALEEVGSRTAASKMRKNSYNNQYHDVRARLFHVLSLKTFNTALLLLDRNREILDYFAAHLLRHSVLRQGDIRAIFEQFGYPLKPTQFGYTLESEI